MECFNRASILAIVASSLAMASGVAHAQVFQRDGTALPQAVGAPELSLVTSRGWKRDTAVYYNFDGSLRATPVTYGELFPNFVDGDAVTLQGLFKWRGEAIDPVLDARTGPGYFSPHCGFSAEIVLHGGTCDLGLGWYNVVDVNSSAPPARTEIYPLVPSDIENFMTCTSETGQPVGTGSGFCPLGWDAHLPYNVSILGWRPTQFPSGSILQDTRYAGGFVAFALIGESTTLCTQTKFTVPAQNVKNTAGDAWITTLMYASTSAPNDVYIAFEDLPMSPEDWRSGSGTARNDGDFNDFVFHVAFQNCPDSCQGVTCSVGTQCVNGVCQISGGSGGSTGNGGSGGSAAGTSGGSASGGAENGGIANGASSGSGASAGSSVPNGSSGAAGTSGAGFGASGNTGAGGCGCRTTRTGVPASAMLLTALLGCATLGRRERRDRKTF